MLILSRKSNESIVIDGRIIVKVIRLEGEMVKIGIEAPSDVPIHRLEVYEEIQKNNQAALASTRPNLSWLTSAQKPNPGMRSTASERTIL